MHPCAHTLSCAVFTFKCILHGRPALTARLTCSEHQGSSSHERSSFTFMIPSGSAVHVIRATSSLAQAAQAAAAAAAGPGSTALRPALLQGRRPGSATAGAAASRGGRRGSRGRRRRRRRKMEAAPRQVQAAQARGRPGGGHQRQRRGKVPCFVIQNDGCCQGGRCVQPAFLLVGWFAHAHGSL